MKTRGPAKKTSDSRPTKRPAMNRSSSLSPPPNDLEEANVNISTSSSTAQSRSSNASTLTLPALAQSYVEHRDEVMGILFKLTKALKEEREWRDTLQSKFTEVEKRQTQIEKRQDEVETRQSALEKRQTEVEDEMAGMGEGSTNDDVEMFPLEERIYDLEQGLEGDGLCSLALYDELEERVIATSGRLDAMEAALEQLSKGKQDKDGTTMDDALAAVHDQRRSFSQQRRQEDQDMLDIERDEARRNTLRNVTDKLLSDLRSSPPGVSVDGHSSPEI